MDLLLDERRIAYETAHTLNTIARVMNCLCIACLLEAKAEVEMAMLGLGDMDAARRRLEQAKERIAACPPVAYMTELIDHTLKMLDRGEYGKAAKLVDEIIDMLFSVRLEELTKYA